MAASKRSFKAEDLYLVRTGGDVRLSPDAKRVAWVQTQFDKESDKAQTSIWVAPADGSEDPRSFTNGPRDTSPRWSPDGQYLAYVSAEEDKPAQLLLARLDGGAPRKVTDEAGGVSQPAWSPDAKRVAFVATVGGRAPAKDQSAVEKAEPRVVRGLFARMDNVGWYDGRRHIFILDVESGEVRQVTDGDWDDDMPSWSPDGALLVFASDRDRRRNDRALRSDAWVIDSNTTKPKPRRLTRARGRAAFPQFSPDGARVAFIGGEDGDQGWDRDAKLWVVSAKTNGESAPQILGADIDRPMGAAFLPVPPFTWTPEGDLLVLVMDQGRISVAKVRSDGSGPTKFALAPEGQIDGFSLSQDGKQIAYTHLSVAEPSEVYVRPLAAKAEPVRVSRLNDEVRDTIALAPLERYTIKAGDGLEVEYFLIRPPAKAGATSSSRRAPVHLEIHGGPHGAHAMGMALAYYQAVVSSGIAVLLPNPRGSSGYGQAFTEGCTGDWGGADFDDMLACVDDVIERGLGDPKRTTVGGYSYGGFMTAWAVGHTNRFKAAVVGAPVIDMVSMTGTSDLTAFCTFAMGGTPWDRPDEYSKRSPLTYLPDVSTPVLIQHWEGDLRCPIGQAEELYTGLKLLGKDAEFVRYPGGSHIGRSPSQAVDRVERIIDWIRTARRAKATSKKR